MPQRIKSFPLLLLITSIILIIIVVFFYGSNYSGSIGLGMIGFSGYGDPCLEEITQFGWNSVYRINGRINATHEFMCNVGDQGQSKYYVIADRPSEYKYCCQKSVALEEEYFYLYVRRLVRDIEHEANLQCLCLNRINSKNGSCDIRKVSSIWIALDDQVDIDLQEFDHYYCDFTCPPP